MNPRLTVIIRPDCAWCYAFEDDWKRLQKVYAGKLDFRRLYQIGPVRTEPAPDFGYVLYEKRRWTRAETLTHTPFNQQLWHNLSPERDRSLPGRLMLIGRMLNREAHALYFMRRAYFQHAIDICGLNQIEFLANAVSITPKRLQTLLKSPELNFMIEEEERKIDRLEPEGMPHLVLEKNHALHHLEISAKSFANFERQINKVLSEN